MFQNLSALVPSWRHWFFLYVLYALFGETLDFISDFLNHLLCLRPHLNHFYRTGIGAGPAADTLGWIDYVKFLRLSFDRLDRTDLDTIRAPVARVQNKGNGF